MHVCMCLSISHTHTHLHRFDASKKFPGVGPRPPSDPEVLSRVEGFTDKWFRQMEHQLEKLGLLNSPRKKSDNKVLVGFPPCAAQKLHWDFDPDVVQTLIKEEKFEGIPISTICSFSPQGSSLTLTLTLTLTLILTQTLILIS